MRADNTDYLRAAAARRHHHAQQRAAEAFRRLRNTGEPITIAGLAKAARVARSWIYTQPDLLQRIRDHTTTETTRQATTASTEASWRSRLDTAHQRIRQLTAENAKLRVQLAAAHGLRRARQTPSATTRTASTTPNLR